MGRNHPFREFGPLCLSSSASWSSTTLYLYLESTSLKMLMHWLTWYSLKMRAGRKRMDFWPQPPRRTPEERTRLWDRTFWYRFKKKQTKNSLNVVLHHILSRGIASPCFSVHSNVCSTNCTILLSEKTRLKLDYPDDYRYFFFLIYLIKTIRSLIDLFIKPCSRSSSVSESVLMVSDSGSCLSGLDPDVVFSDCSPSSWRVDVLCVPRCFSALL